MKILFSCVLSLALMVSQVCADIALTTTPGLTFAQNSGTQSFQLFAQAAPGDASIIALLSTVTIDSGTPGLGGFTGPISFASNFNAANVNPFSSGVVDPLDSRIAYLSLDFTSPQAIPTGSPGVFGTFSFNVDGLNPGFYGILLSDAASDGPNVVTNSGGFTITGTAVPEPTSILTAASLGMGGVFFRRRRVKVSKSKKASVQA
jgi:hypothetical protein